MMDHETWMYNIDRFTPDYVKGLSEFMKCAEAHQKRVRGTLIFFDTNYTCWNLHGEIPPQVDNDTIVSDFNMDENFGNDNNHRDNLDEMSHDAKSNVDEKNVKKLQQLFDDAEKPLFEGCPKQPGNDIDVYLCPLIDDMIDLWETGVEIYDAYKKERFQLFAMIYCTINDFPAYSNLSGNTIYMRHWRALHRHHPYRKKENLFDGTSEDRSMPKLMDGYATLYQVADLNITFGKKFKAPPKRIWKKRSIFWELKYWTHILVRHCLDVMHIEKNVCESLLGLLLNIPGKKDGVNARKDMLAMGIRSELTPQETNGKKIYLPPACYTLSKAEKTSFCECLHGIKVLSGYSANIKNLVSMKDLKLLGMKSHDCHVLLTQMILIAIRGLMPPQVRQTITKLCLFFNMIHSKVLDHEKLEELQRDIILILCQLEMYFPPSFFDVMVHLVSHIVEEIKIAGVVFLRYMYPFERYMGFLKGYVRNRYRPEGSIIQRYTAEEVVQFCTNYMDDVTYIGLSQPRHQGRLEGVGQLGAKMLRPTLKI
nr:hypothetical protein [Tanacetum cinerariifolium]